MKIIVVNLQKFIMFFRPKKLLVVDWILSHYNLLCQLFRIEGPIITCSSVSFKYVEDVGVLIKKKRKINEREKNIYNVKNVKLLNSVIFIYNGVVALSAQTDNDFHITKKRDSFQQIFWQNSIKINEISQSKLDLESTKKSIKSNSLQIIFSLFHDINVLT